MFWIHHTNKFPKGKHVSQQAALFFSINICLIFQIIDKMQNSCSVVFFYDEIKEYVKMAKSRATVDNSEDTHSI